MSKAPEISVVYYFRAPTTYFFDPVVVGKNMLYVELMLGGSVSFDGGSYSRGTVFCHKYRDRTLHDFPKGRPYRVLMFLFENYRHAKWNLPRIGKWRHPDSLDSFVHQAPEEFNRETTDRQLLSEYLFSALRLNLAEIGEVREEKTLAKEIFVVRNKLEQLDVSANWEKLSAYAGYSPAYLRNFFAGEFQIPPGRYRLEHRLKNACKLLRETTLPIKEVAEQSCFRHLETFYRAFKKHIGVTPGEYRNGEN